MRQVSVEAIWGSVGYALLSLLNLPSSSSVCIPEPDLGPPPLSILELCPPKTVRPDCQASSLTVHCRQRHPTKDLQTRSRRRPNTLAASCDRVLAQSTPNFRTPDMPTGEKFPLFGQIGAWATANRSGRLVPGKVPPVLFSPSHTAAIARDRWGELRGARVTHSSSPVGSMQAQLRRAVWISVRPSCSVLDKTAGAIPPGFPQR